MSTLLLMLWLSGSVARESPRMNMHGEARPRAAPLNATATRAHAATPALLETFDARLPAQARNDRWIAPDKLQHFLLALGITSFAFGAADLAGASDDVRMALAVGAGAVAGVTKEVVDMRGGSFFSAKDLVLDGLGIVAAVALLRSAR